MLLYLSLLVVLVACERVIREFEVPEKRFGQMYSFGFLPGGSARVRIVSSNPTAQLAFLLCAEVRVNDDSLFGRVPSAYFSTFFFPFCYRKSTFSSLTFARPSRRI